MADYSNLPRHVIEHIFVNLNVGDRCRMMNATVKWRDILLSKDLWTKVNYHLTLHRDVTQKKEKGERQLYNYFTPSSLIQRFCLDIEDLRVSSCYPRFHQRNQLICEILELLQHFESSPALKSFSMITIGFGQIDCHLDKPRDELIDYLAMFLSRLVQLRKLELPNLLCSRPEAALILRRLSGSLSSELEELNLLNFSKLRFQLSCVQELETLLISCRKLRILKVNFNTLSESIIRRIAVSNKNLRELYIEFRNGENFKWPFQETTWYNLRREIPLIQVHVIFDRINSFYIFERHIVGSMPIVSFSYKAHFICLGEDSIEPEIPFMMKEVSSTLVQHFSNTLKHIKIDLVNAEPHSLPLYLYLLISGVNQLYSFSLRAKMDDGNWNLMVQNCLNCPSLRRVKFVCVKFGNNVPDLANLFKWGMKEFQLKGVSFIYSI